MTVCRSTVTNSLRTLFLIRQPAQTRRLSPRFFPTHSCYPSSTFAFYNGSAASNDFPRSHKGHRIRTFAAMASSTPMEQLVKQVDGLSLDAITDSFPNCHPTINPFDLYRAHLAKVLGEVTGVDTKVIYPNLQWTLGLDKGDFALATPSLRLKGKKFDELAKEWTEKVRVIQPVHPMRC